MSLLRPLDRSDLPLMQRFGQQPEVWSSLGLPAAPNEAEWNNRFSSPSGDTAHRFGLFEEGELKAFGEIQNNMRARARHCAWLYWAAPDPQQAAPFLKHLLRFSDLWLGTARLECSLEAKNPLGVTLLEQGFEKEVLKRQHRESGDVIAYGRLRPGWTPATPTPPPLFVDGGPRVLPTLRPMKVEDAAAIATQMSDERVAWGTLQLPSVSADYWRPRLEQPRGTSLIAEVDGQMVGNAGIHPYSSPSAHAAMLGMSVAAPWQGRGVAGPLMEALISAARQQGLQRIDLEVYSDNDRALRLYRRFGFVTEGKKRYDVWRYGGHASSDVMGLHL